jgi:hypothetical protein
MHRPLWLKLFTCVRLTNSETALHLLEVCLFLRDFKFVWRAIRKERCTVFVRGRHFGQRRLCLCPRTRNDISFMSVNKWLHSRRGWHLATLCHRHFPICEKGFKPWLLSRRRATLCRSDWPSLLSTCIGSPSCMCEDFLLNFCLKRDAKEIVHHIVDSTLFLFWRTVKSWSPWRLHQWIWARPHGCSLTRTVRGGGNDSANGLPFYYDPSDFHVDKLNVAITLVLPSYWEWCSYLFCL